MTVDFDRQASGGMADGGRRTVTATTEVGFPPDFFPSSNRFLRFPSDLQNCCMKIVSVFLLFIEILVSVVGSSKWFTGVHILSGKYLFWRMSVCFFCSIFMFTGVLFCFKRL